MASLFPLQFDIDPPVRSPRVIRIDEAAAADVCSVLSTATARGLLGELYQNPTTLSNLADSTGTSVQNVAYHIDRLADVEIVEVIDTWYSNRGREMDVYAPTNDPLVLVGGALPSDRAIPIRGENLSGRE